MIPARRAPRLRKKKGSYYADFYDRHRGRKWVALGTKNQRDAQRRFIELSDAYMRGDYDPWQEALRRTVLLSEAIAAYARHREAEGYGRHSTRQRLRVLERFASFLAPEITVDRVTVQDVRRFIHQPGLADYTRCTYYARLNTFFTFCVTAGYAPHNPCDEIRRPKAPRKAVNYLTVEQLDRLLTTIEAHHRMRGARAGEILWFADVVRFAAGSGLRLGELCALQWKDVNVEEALVVVRSNRREHRTKTGDERTVHISPDAAEVLRRLYAERGRQGGYVFQSPGGEGRLSYARTSRLFRKYRRMAQLPESLTFHSLRKTYGTVLASAGVPLRTIQKLLGHSDIRITARTYADVFAEAVREQVERAFAGYAR
ncbi:MAG: site-specific integrase [Bacteroidetes bacterium]|nr:MAG: site-specific integrase [Bacteroidota bacterium]